MRSSLSNAYDLPVSVDYATSPDSATAGSDYLPASGRLTFAPGETSKPVAVPILDDRLVELVPVWDYGVHLVDAPEIFYLSLSNASSYAGYNASFATVGIRDNEPRINFNATPLTVSEGNSGTTSVVATVRLSNAYDQAVTVDYTTSDFYAQAGSDYLAVSGSLTFAPGETSKPITVTVLGDRLGEFDEFFHLDLANASSNAYISGRGSVSIVDDEPEVYLEPASPPPTYYLEVPEGNGGTTPVVYSIRLSAPYDETCLDYRTWALSCGASLDPYNLAQEAATLSLVTRIRSRASAARDALIPLAKLPLLPGQRRVEAAGLGIVSRRPHDCLDVSADVPLGVGEPLVAGPDRNLPIAPLWVVQPPLEVAAERPRQPPDALTAHDLEGVIVPAQLVGRLVGGRPQEQVREAMPIELADSRLDVRPGRVGHFDGPPVLAGRVFDVLQHPNVHAA